MAFPTNLSNVVDGVDDVVAAHLNNLEAKVGINGSAVATSLDYLLKNPASIDPGHKHSKLWASDGSPEAVTVDAAGNVGIGTASPATTFEIFAANSPRLRIHNGTDGQGGLQFYSDYPNADERNWELTNAYDVMGTLQFRVSTVQNGAPATSVLAMSKEGNVGIGTASPGAQLHTTGSVRFANFGAGAATFDASGNISSASDERLKTILGKYNGGIDQLMGIEPILHRWNKLSGMETKRKYVGFSANNIQKSMPEAVYKNKETGILSYTDKALLAALVNAVKQHEVQIKELYSQLN